MDRLLISFSGGETSAYMAQLKSLRDSYKDVACVFANTGQENEETLEFVRQCDSFFNLKAVWVEAEVEKEKGKGTKHRIVNFETADRTGKKSFEPVIAKYGIPNMSMPHCTRELKQAPIYSYIHSIWEKGSFDIAIGIRADEFDRMSASAAKNNIVYPLVKLGITKPMINTFWRDMPFRLNLKGYQGNCKWCWKKTFRKHITILREAPEYYDFPREMEEKYAMVGALAEKTNTAQRFFRKNMTVEDLVKRVPDKKIENYPDDSQEFSLFHPDLDVAGVCNESCEVFHEV